MLIKIIFRKVLDKNIDYKEEAMRIILGYLPFSTWPLAISLFEDTLSSAFLASTQALIQDKGLRIWGYVNFLYQLEISKPTHF